MLGGVWFYFNWVKKEGQEVCRPSDVGLSVGLKDLPLPTDCRKILKTLSGKGEYDKKHYPFLA